MSSGYHEKLMSFRGRSDMDETFSDLLRTEFKDKISPELNGAEKCLAIGTGAGLREITFIKCLLPNLRMFAAVEPDPESAAKLKTNLQLHLPDVESIVYEKSLQDFIREDEQSHQAYNIVLMIHVLLCINEEDRRLSIEKIFDNVLCCGGFVVIDHMVGSDGFDSFAKIINELAPDNKIPHAAVLKEEFLASGFQLNRDLKYPAFFDFSNPDDNLIKFVSSVMSRLLSADEFQTAVRHVWPDGKGCNSGIVMVFQKP